MYYVSNLGYLISIYLWIECVEMSASGTKIRGLLHTYLKKGLRGEKAESSQNFSTLRCIQKTNREVKKLRG